MNASSDAVRAPASALGRQRGDFEARWALALRTTAGVGAAAGDDAFAVRSAGGCAAGVADACGHVVDDEPTLGRPTDGSSGRYVSCRFFALWRDGFGTKF